MDAVHIRRSAILTEDQPTFLIPRRQPSLECRPTETVPRMEWPPPRRHTHHCYQPYPLPAYAACGFSFRDRVGLSSLPYM